MIRNANTEIKKLGKDNLAMETGFIYCTEIIMVHMLREFKEADKKWQCSIRFIRMAGSPIATMLNYLCNLISDRTKNVNMQTLNIDGRITLFSRNRVQTPKLIKPTCSLRAASTYILLHIHLSTT